MFKVRVTCPDCTGVDFMGCGDGKPWHLYEKKTGEVRLFDTREEAQEAADEDNMDTIYNYEIIECQKS